MQVQNRFPAKIRATQNLTISRSASVTATPPRKRAGRRGHDAIAVVDKHLLTRIRERDFGLWTLEAHHAGDVSLKLDDDEVAFISRSQGVSMLSLDACPYIRAAEIVAALLSGLAVELSVRLRAELEFALARWIPLYFDL